MNPENQTFEKRVLAYIQENYDVPAAMIFFVDGQETDLEDWIEEYVAEYNENVQEPFGDESDDFDVRSVGEEILSLLTREDLCLTSVPAGARCQVFMEAAE